MSVLRILFDASFSRLLRCADKSACRPLLSGTWSSFATTFLLLPYLCLRVADVHSSSVEDDVVYLLTSLSLFRQYTAATKVNFHCSFTLIH